MISQLVTRTEHTGNALPETVNHQAQSLSDLLVALTGKLSEAGRAASEARIALNCGETTAAISALLPTEQVLRDALALHTAAVVLHLEPC
ncbi:hypothetical protein VT84_06600 [Gemmata sp. SH-PL17]|uniref:hypothetical protein n=1 Tax=Gemmata sp. SH-PL17 TaxID=1630693 RepID=UPI00078C74C1|nr:hypothetical protein [Gemmata sp. SH-PL17]AMV24047.1 hypothetical protein VT84_06600 [Gemmata sp. SH-PL17]